MPARWTVCGSVVTMDAAVRNIVKFANRDLRTLQVPWTRLAGRTAKQASSRRVPADRGS